MTEAIGRVYDNRTTIGFESCENLVRRLGDAPRAVVEEMTVPLEHHPGVGMAKTAGNRKRIFPRFDEQRVGGMTQTVERDIRKFRQLEQRFEDPADEVALAQGRLVRRFKDEAVLGATFGLVRKHRGKCERRT